MEIASTFLQFGGVIFLGLVALFGVGCTLEGPNTQTVMATIGAIVLFGIMLAIV